MEATKELLILYAQWKLQFPRGTVTDFYSWLVALKGELDFHRSTYPSLDGTI